MPESLPQLGQDLVKEAKANRTPKFKLRIKTLEQTSRLMACQRGDYFWALSFIFAGTKQHIQASR